MSFNAINTLAPTRRFASYLADGAVDTEHYFDSGAATFEVLESPHSLDGVVGASPALREALRNVHVAAPTDATVLVLGETGTGKELIAHAVHRLSSRANYAFIRVNCAAMPANLLESELFGHERGAFTGAVTRRIGRFELANRGTLFLDEIGDLPLELQPKLLRVLQEQEFERVGGSDTRHCDVRVVAATSRDLRSMVAAGEFRRDLYYRLHVFPIRIPALRERREDIALLVRHFVRYYAQRLGRSIDRIEPSHMEALVSYDWPGNVRELQNFVQRSVIVSAENVLRPPLTELCSLEIDAANNDVPCTPTLRDAERDLILLTLRDTRWVVGGPKGAALRLGLNRTTLISRMQKLGINKP